jgi:hypothetical protein
MSTRALILIALLLVAPAACNPPVPDAAVTQQTPVEPRGLLLRDGYLIRWGCSRKDLSAHVSRKDMSCDKVLGDCKIEGNEILPDPYWSATLSFDDKGKFFSVYLRFHYSHFDEVKEALTTALKAPANSDKRSTLQNGFGATYDQEEVWWRIGHVEIEARARGTTEDSLYMGWLAMAYDASKPTPALPAKAPF